MDDFLALPEDLLSRPDRKERLYRTVFGDALPEYVYERPKVRAQVGSRDGGGVLGACLDQGVDSAWLRRRFAELHGAPADTELDRFIRGGTYRAGIPGEPSEARGPG